MKDKHPYIIQPGNKTIIKLKDRLVTEGIDFEFEYDHPIAFSDHPIAFRLSIPVNKTESLSVIQGPYSYGGNNDKLEMMGGLTKEESKYDSVIGYLTFENAFERIKYCVDNKTLVYKENK